MYPAIVPGQTEFVYCPQLYFPFDIGIDERLRMFKKIRGVLEMYPAIVPGQTATPP